MIVPKEKSNRQIEPANDTVVSSFSPRIESTPKPSFTKASFTPTIESTKSLGQSELTNSAGKTHIVKHRTRSGDQHALQGTYDIEPDEMTKTIENQHNTVSPSQLSMEKTKVLTKPSSNARALKSTHRKPRRKTTKEIETTKVIKSRKPRSVSPESDAEEETVDDIQEPGPSEKTKLLKKGKKKKSRSVSPKSPDSEAEAPETTKIVKKGRKKSQSFMLTQSESEEESAEATKVVKKGKSKKPRPNLPENDLFAQPEQPSADDSNEAPKIKLSDLKRKSRRASKSAVDSSEAFDNSESRPLRSRKRKSDESLPSNNEEPVQNEHFESVNFELTKSQAEEEDENEQEEEETGQSNKKKRRSSVRFAKDNKTHEIPHHEEEEESQMSGDEANVDKNRRKTLDRRGAKKPKKTLKKSDFMKTKDEESEIDRHKQLFYQHCVILPEDNENNLRRSKRTRFKTGTLVRRFTPMLMEKDIKLGNFHFNEMKFDKYSFGGIDNKLATKKKNQAAVNKKISPKTKKTQNVEEVINNLNETDLNLVVDDLTAKIEFETKNGSVSLDTFVNHENVPFIDMATGEQVDDLSEGPISQRQKRILVKTHMHLGGITKGMMYFGPKAIKESTSAGSTTVFEVSAGLFKVTINEQIRIVPEGHDFFVLVDNDYKLENISKGAGVLKFTMTREDIEDHEQTINMGGQRQGENDVDVDDSSLFDANEKTNNANEQTENTEGVGVGQSGFDESTRDDFDVDDDSV